MPARFVEVVDVGAEASGVVASLISKGQGWVGQLSFNISDYINGSTMSVERLREAFATHNITLDSQPDDWREWAINSTIGAALNQTAVDVPPLEGNARHLITTGLAMILVRELYVQWKLRILLKHYGVHATRGEPSAAHAHAS